MSNQTTYGNNEYFYWFECVSSQGNLYEKSQRLVREIQKHSFITSVALCLTNERDIIMLYNSFCMEYASMLSYSKIRNLYKNATPKPYHEKDGDTTIVFQAIVYNKNIIGFLIYIPDKSKISIANNWYIRNSESLVKAYYILTVEKSLLELQMMDNLTGCFNEGVLRDKLSNEIGLPDKQLAVININDFDQINAQYGYSNGNSILKEVSILLHSGVNQQEYVYRLYGDKFAILLSGDFHLGFKRLLDLKNMIEANEFTHISNSNLAIRIMITIGVVDLAREDKNSSIDAIYRKAISAGRIMKNGINYSDEKEVSSVGKTEILCENSVPVKKSRPRKKKESKEGSEELMQNIALFKETSMQSENPYFKIFNI